MLTSVISRYLMFIFISAVLIYQIHRVSILKQKIPFDLLLLLFLLFFTGKTVNIDLKFVQLIGSVPLWLPCILFLIMNKDNLQDYFISYNNWLDSISVGICIGLLLALTVNFVYNYQQPNPSFWIWLNQFSIVLGEELLFRSILTNILLKLKFNRWATILAQSVIFLFGHLRYAFHSNWIALVGIFMMSLFAGIMVLKYRNFLGAFSLHLAYNLFFFANFSFNIGG